MLISGAFENNRLQRIASMPYSLQYSNLQSSLERLNAYIEKRRSHEAILEIARETRFFNEIIAINNQNAIEFLEIEQKLCKIMEDFQ